MHTPIKGHNAVLGLYKFAINLSGETKPEKRHFKKMHKETTHSFSVNGALCAEALS